MGLILNFGDRVALSTLFLRSIGGIHPLSEVHGIVQWRHIEYDWQLVGVVWDNRVENSVNAKNLVLLQDKEKEARRVEHNNEATGITIGYRRKSKRL